MNALKRIFVSLFIFSIIGSAFAQSVLRVSQGGTGNSSITGIPFGNGQQPFSTLQIGTGLDLTGDILSATGGTGITSLNSLTGDVNIIAGNNMQVMVQNPTTLRVTAIPATPVYGVQYNSDPAGFFSADPEFVRNPLTKEFFVGGALDSGSPFNISSINNGINSSGDSGAFMEYVVNGGVNGSVSLFTGDGTTSVSQPIYGRFEAKSAATGGNLTYVAIHPEAGQIEALNNNGNTAIVNASNFGGIPSVSSQIIEGDVNANSNVSGSGIVHDFTNVFTTDHGIISTNGLEFLASLTNSTTGFQTSLAFDNSAPSSTQVINNGVTLTTTTATSGSIQNQISGGATSVRSVVDYDGESVSMNVSTATNNAEINANSASSFATHSDGSTYESKFQADGAGVRMSKIQLATGDKTQIDLNDGTIYMTGTLSGNPDVSLFNIDWLASTTNIGNCVATAGTCSKTDENALDITHQAKTSTHQGTMQIDFDSFSLSSENLPAADLVQFAGAVDLNLFQIRSIQGATGYSTVVDGFHNKFEVRTDGPADRFTYTQANTGIDFIYRVTSTDFPVFSMDPDLSSTAHGKFYSAASHRFATRVVTAAGAVTVSALTDYRIVVNKTVGAATTVNLPSSPSQGDTYVIKDGKRDAGTNNITIVPASGNIEGAANLVMNLNGQSVTIFYSGTEWLVQ